MQKQYQNNVVKMIFPAVLFGAVTGAFTAVAVVLYKYCAKYVIHRSEEGYHYLREHLQWLPLLLGCLLGVAFLLAYIYRKIPNLRGGGIPTSIGILRGIIPMKWLRNVIGIFVLSLVTFLIGVPLGNEGPSVQMGTAVGRGSVFMLTKKKRAWDRYAMTGGACAGFSVATGAPISGILFAVEEAHQRISPIILIMATTSVMIAEIVNVFLSDLLGVSRALFSIPSEALHRLSTKELWIPLLIGIAVGLFAVVFLKYYAMIVRFVNRALKKIPHGLLIFFVFTLTVGLGLLSYDFISTGHHLMLSLFDGKTSLWMLFLLLLVRSTLTLGANSNRITGGIFLPLLALGTLVAMILGKGFHHVFGLGEDYYTVVLVLGITACIASMMKMPLTAIIFSIEALALDDHILSVIVVVAVSYMITEIFGVNSINDSVLERRIEDLHEGRHQIEIDTRVTVQSGSFAIGKQIRDIFWPNNLFVLSVEHVDAPKSSSRAAKGGKEMREGDILHIHCKTFDAEQTMEELCAIVGEQPDHRNDSSPEL